MENWVLWLFITGLCGVGNIIDVFMMPNLVQQVITDSGTRIAEESSNRARHTRRNCHNHGLEPQAREVIHPFGCNTSIPPNWIPAGCKISKATQRIARNNRASFRDDRLTTINSPRWMYARNSVVKSFHQKPSISLSPLTGPPSAPQRGRTRPP